MNEINHKIRKLEEVINVFQAFTGLILEKTPTNTMMLLFQGLNPKDYDFCCSIELSIFNDTFLIQDFNPKTPDYYDVVQFATVFKDLKNFVRAARRSFIEFFQIERPNKQQAQNF